MRLCVFFRHPQVKRSRLQNKTFFRYYELINSVMFLRIKHTIVIDRKIFCKMYIVTIRSQAIKFKIGRAHV